MSEIHVALVTPWNQRGGIATYSEKFAAEFEKADIKTTIIQIENTESTNPFEFIELLTEIPSDVDVIHVQYEAGLFGNLGMSGIGAPAFFFALNRTDFPVVVTLHEVHAEHPHRDPVGDHLLQLRDTIIERLALRAADATVVHTSQAKEVLESRHGDHWRIERMLHPTDAGVDPIPTDRAKAELGVEGPVALTFGFVEEKKRYKDMIHVLPELPDLTYLIAGGFREGEGETVFKRVQELAQDLGVTDRVRHLGYVEESDVPVVFSAADVVVLPYERVSQSGVVNDALAYRRPVVASSLPAFNELREEYECLLIYTDQNDLYNQISSVLDDSELRDHIQRQINEYVETVSWQNFSTRSRKIYETIRVSH
jgi:glycosyltransferase involved in cell wall biosynthesis